MFSQTNYSQKTHIRELSTTYVVFIIGVAKVTGESMEKSKPYALLSYHCQNCYNNYLTLNAVNCIVMLWIYYTAHHLSTFEFSEKIHLHLGLSIFQYEKNKDVNPEERFERTYKVLLLFIHSSCNLTFIFKKMIIEGYDLNIQKNIIFGKCL